MNRKVRYLSSHKLGDVLSLYINLKHGGLVFIFGGFFLDIETGEGDKMSSIWW
jgi:hypothetical protein